MFGYCEEFQATPGYGLCCNVMGMELFAELEDNLDNIVCVADQLPRNVDGNCVLKEEEGGAAGLQKLQVLVGNREWLKQNGYEVTAAVEKIIAENEMTGQTVVLAGIEGDNTAVVCSLHLPTPLCNRRTGRTDCNGRHNQTGGSRYSVYIAEKEN